MQRRRVKYRSENSYISSLENDACFDPFIRVKQKPLSVLVVLWKYKDDNNYIVNIIM